MGDPDRQDVEPGRTCESGLHTPGSERVAYWIVTRDVSGPEMWLCPSCHFLAVRWGTVLTEKRLPWEKMTFEVPLNIGQAELWDAIEGFKEQAAHRGYELQVAGFYDIKSYPERGVLLITFRKL